MNHRILTKSAGLYSFLSFSNQQRGHMVRCGRSVSGQWRVVSVTQVGTHSTAQRRGWRATERCCNQWPWLLYTHCLEQVRPPAWAGLDWLGWAGWAGLVRGNLAADLPRPGPGCWLQECCPPAPGCCRPAQPSPAQPSPAQPSPGLTPLEICSFAAARTGAATGHVSLLAGAVTCLC